MTISMRFLHPFAVMALLCVPAAAQEEWTAFRGPAARNVAADDPRLPESWGAEQNVVWAQEVPGTGWSSPIVTGGRIFVTTVRNDGETEEPKKGLYFGGNRLEPMPGVHHWEVHCLRFEDGAPCWQREVYQGAPEFARHLKNSYASETPTSDGERVYAYFGNLGIWAFTLDGDPVWEKRIPASPTRFGWGTAASPVVHDGVLYIVNDNDAQSYLLALDAATGAEKWRVERDEGSNWATPFVWRNGLRTELVTAGTDAVRAYDLSGQLLWQLRGMSSIVIPQPFAAGDLLYVASGYVGDNLRPTYAIKPGANGDISLAEGAASNEFIAWSQPQSGPYNPTPLVYGDLYYTLLDRGFLTARDARSGEEVYDKQRLERGAGGFTASPWAYNGKVFALNEDCDAYVIEAGREFKVVGKSSLDDMCMSTPAMVDGNLILRTRSRVYRFTDRTSTAQSGH